MLFVKINIPSTSLILLNPEAISECITKPVLSTSQEHRWAVLEEFIHRGKTEAQKISVLWNIHNVKNNKCLG